MANKTLTGIVLSTKMNGSVTVEVTRKTPHPLYKKLITRSKKYVVGTNGLELSEGEVVTIVETRKMAGNKHFKVVRSSNSEKERKTK